MEVATSAGRDHVSFEKQSVDTRKKLFSVGLAGWLFIPLLALADVPLDRIPSSRTLPQRYPDSWVVVFATTYGVGVGSYAIVDAAAETTEYKGQFQGAFYPAVIDKGGTSSLYVAESYFERASHGKRTDVLTILDKSTLAPIGEVTLPGMKRGILPGSTLDISRDGQLALVLNFTPASSVTVTDLRARRVLNEVPIPGCTSIYPSGQRGFASLCGNGAMTSFELGDHGQVVREHRTDSFNDIDRDWLFLQPAWIEGVAYFVTAKGNVSPVDLSGAEPKLSPRWPLMTPEQASDGWRTGDGVFAAGDDARRLYVRLYRETGYDKQRSDNTEVWVYDVTSHKRLKRIPLKNGGSSIDITRGDKPYLLAVVESDPSGGASVDVYDALTGDWVRNIGGWAAGTFLSLPQAKR